MNTYEESENLEKQKQTTIITKMWLESFFYLAGIGAFIKYLFTNENQNIGSFSPLTGIILGIILVAIIIIWMRSIKKE